MSFPPLVKDAAPAPPAKAPKIVPDAQLFVSPLGTVFCAIAGLICTFDSCGYLD